MRSRAGREPHRICARHAAPPIPCTS